MASKLMKKSVWMSACAIALGIFLVAHAQESPATSATVEDLEAAGYTDVIALGPDGSRFASDVDYFRVAETLSDADARKDCADCANLVAAYVAKTDSVPDWHATNEDPLRLVGGRVQARRYHPPTKTVIIVTGPVLEKVAALSDRLLIRVNGGN